MNKKVFEFLHEECIAGVVMSALRGSDDREESREWKARSTAVLRRAVGSEYGMTNGPRHFVCPHMASHWADHFRAAYHALARAGYEMPNEISLAAYLDPAAAKREATRFLEGVYGHLYLDPKSQDLVYGILKKVRETSVNDPVFKLKLEPYWNWRCWR